MCVCGMYRIIDCDLAVLSTCFIIVGHDVIVVFTHVIFIYVLINVCNIILCFMHLLWHALTDWLNMHRLWFVHFMFNVGFFWHNRMIAYFVYNVMQLRCLLPCLLTCHISAMSFTHVCYYRFACDVMCSCMLYMVLCDCLGQLHYLSSI